MAEEALLVHIAKAAERLGLSQQQVRGLIDRGELPSTKVSNRIYIPNAAVADYVMRIGQTA